MREHLPRRMLYRSLTDRSGVAALEFALVAGLLITLLLATFDIGIIVLQYAELNTALRAGGQYAIAFPSDSNGIQNAVTNALPASLQSSVTTQVGCECLTNGSPSACGAVKSGACNACPSGTTQRFIHILSNVSTSTWLTTPLAITKLAAPSACYVARVQ